MSKPIVAIVGRPNVGKSTLFNQIGKRRISIVDDMPGVTRDRIYADAEWLGRAFTMVDTGGIEFEDETFLTPIREQARIAVDEADVIVTNPPFSLFREFLSWIIEAGKDFLIIGNINAITYKEVFPLIMSNRMWLGESIHSGDREFGVPKEYPLDAAGWRVDEKGNRFIRVKGVRWFTNLEHGRRHQPLQLMTMADNTKYSRHKEVKGVGYRKYVNYDAIEVPFTDAIPSDYDGVMGVPISFLDKYCPEQVEIIGIGLELADMKPIKERLGKLNGGPRLYIEVEGELIRQYERILIRRRK